MTDRETCYTLRQRRQREMLQECQSVKDIARWLDENVVGDPVVTSDFQGRTLDQRKSDLRALAGRQYTDTLNAGFVALDGTRWPMTEGAKGRVLELTQRIQEHRAGKTSTPLPNGKDKARLWDAEGNRHLLTPDEIINISEQGTDFKDEAEDRLEELLWAIETAASHDELGGVDVTTGWPGQ